MNAHMRRAAVAATATAMAVALAACGSAKQSGGGSANAPKKAGDAFKVGLLLPENQTARYEALDKPLFEQKVKDLTNGKAQVLYSNAQGDASAQSQQVDTMITSKVNVLVVDAVDFKAIASSIKKAKEQGIKVVAYDRLAQGPIDAYTSFDNEAVGKAQGTALLQALGSKPKSGKIVMMNGDVADPNAAPFKKGALSVLDGKVNVGKSFDVPKWDASDAGAKMTTAVSSLGKANIIGVYSANDSMAGGVITAMKQAGFTKIPPVTGQDAELAAVQRVLTDEQYMSVYKSYPQEAAHAAEMAVALAQGKSLTSISTSTVNNGTVKSVPSAIVPVVSLTKANINQTVLKEKIYTVAQICTAKYKAACAAAGVK